MVAMRLKLCPFLYVSFRHRSNLAFSCLFVWNFSELMWSGQWMTDHADLYIFIFQCFPSHIPSSDITTRRPRYTFFVTWRTLSNSFTSKLKMVTTTSQLKLYLLLHVTRIKIGEAVCGYCLNLFYHPHSCLFFLFYLNSS